MSTAPANQKEMMPTPAFVLANATIDRDREFDQTARTETPGPRAVSPAILEHRIQILTKEVQAANDARERLGVEISQLTERLMIANRRIAGFERIHASFAALIDKAEAAFKLATGSHFIEFLDQFKPAAAPAETPTTEVAAAPADAGENAGVRAADLMLKDAATAVETLTGRQPKQWACERCTYGVMDKSNPHLWGRCTCSCHVKPPLSAGTENGIIPNDPTGIFDAPAETPIANADDLCLCGHFRHRHATGGNELCFAGPCNCDAFQLSEAAAVAPPYLTSKHLR